MCSSQFWMYVAFFFAAFGVFRLGVDTMMFLQHKRIQRAQREAQRTWQQLKVRLAEQKKQQTDYAEKKFF